jgi:hypothetical protein
MKNEADVLANNINLFYWFALFHFKSWRLDFGFIGKGPRVAPLPARASASMRIASHTVIYRDSAMACMSCSILACETRCTLPSASKTLRWTGQMAMTGCGFKSLTLVLAWIT